MEEVAWAIAYASQASVGIPIIILFGLRNFKDTLTLSVTALFFASFLSDTLSMVEDFRGNSNLYVLNIYQVIQFLLLSAIYSKLLIHQRRSIYWSTGAFILFFIVVTFYFQEITTYQSMVRLAAGIILIVYSTLYWYHIYVTQPTSRLRHHPEFWFNTAIFTYFTFNLFLFTIFNYLLKVSNEASLAIWIWHNLNNIAKNVLFAVGIFYLRR